MPLTESFTIVSVFAAFAIVGLAIGILAWPALGRTLLAYGLAARIPVALLMLVAMLGNWGTHYDAHPSTPQMSALGWWVGIGLVPQLFFWMWITIVFGALFGIVAAAIARRRIHGFEVSSEGGVHARAVDDGSLQARSFLTSSGEMAWASTSLASRRSRKRLISRAGR
ncbi:MAG TPA: hypothetical protein VL691_02800 [Vicinamibacteria bacterium]|nr:hypothetical protein [Vicinamibacteria bacterium]